MAKMRFTFILIFQFTLGINGYSQDSCTFSVSIDCPKFNSKYWDYSISATNDNENFSFIDNKGKTTLPKGQYTFTLYSKFRDSFDTIITLNKDKQKVVFQIKWNYIFENYSSSIIETEGDTITIFYERKYCRGGTCSRDRDKMELVKNLNGQYSVRYYDPFIRGENCLDVRKNNWGEMILKIETASVIDNYFSSNFVPYNKNRVIECIVKIGRHIYVMNSDTYLKFRAELLY